jgi:DNA modification methylase
MDIEQRDPAELVPADYNPRKIDDHQLDALKRSLDRWGFVEPVVMNKRTGRIVGGHQRVKAALALAVPEVPTVWVDIDEEGEKALNIALNQISGEWEEDKLAALLDELEAKGQSLEELGFKQDRLDDLLAELRQGPELQGDLDEVPEPPAEPITQPGDLWQLGEHRLLCGDSTKAEDVARLMGGAKADAVVTDPPYGIKANKQTLGTGKKQFQRGEAWDEKPADVRALATMADQVIIWGGNYFSDQLPPTNDWLCWHKKNDGLSFSEFELAWTSLGINCRHLSHHWAGEEKAHPTQKPLAVMVWCVGLTEGNILEPYAGSGTTIIAAEQTGRKCYAMELSPAYCDVAVARWEKATGRKAERLPADG